MIITREDFLSAMGRFRAQQKIDLQAPELVDNSDLWIAAISLLGLLVGPDGRKWVESWIYDADFGRFPDPQLGNAKTDGEFYDFLQTKFGAQ